MTRKKTRHHYVPKFHIKRWTNQDGKVWHYSRGDGGSARRRGPAEIFNQHGLNDVRKSGLSEPRFNREGFEQRFAELDSEAATALEALLVRPKHITEANKNVWLRFMNSLPARHPSHIRDKERSIVEHWRQHLEVLPQHRVDQLLSITSEEAEAGNGARFHSVTTANEQVPDDFNWTLASGVWLISSDRPIVNWRMPDHRTLSMPLAPNTLLILSTDDLGADALRMIACLTNLQMLAQASELIAAEKLGAQIIDVWMRLQAGEIAPASDRTPQRD